MSGDLQRRRWSEGRGPRRTRTDAARAGHRAGQACYRRRSAYGRPRGQPSTSEVGAVCGKAARTVLCGGRPVMGVPTAFATLGGLAGLRDPQSGQRRRVPTLLSPLLANLYMRRFVLGWKKLGLEQSLGTRLVTYADDLVILCRRAARRRRCTTVSATTDDAGGRVRSGSRRQPTGAANALL